MAKRPLTIVDNGFLITETNESPKHIAGLQTYKIPTKASKNFVKNLYESWVTVDTVCAPYNLILKIHFHLIGKKRLTFKRKIMYFS